MFADYLTLIDHHLNSYRGFQAADLYKLLYQSTLGPEHLLTDVEQARFWLQKEWVQEAANATEQLYEPISLDGQLGRLHLRPFKAAGHDWQELWTSFYQTCLTWQADKNSFITIWQQALDWIKQGCLSLSVEQAIELDSVQSSRGYPAVRHSESYRLINKPAYRVVLNSWNVQR